MDSTIKRYLSFLNNGKTERECVNQIIKIAEKNGYQDVLNLKTIDVGDKFYFNNQGKSIALFHIGKDDIENGMNILGGHIDSPRLDIKMNPLYESDGLVYLDTHYYGGIKKYQWVTLPLSIHGVVVKKDGTKKEIVIGEDGDNALCITDLLPHIAQEQMKKNASEFIEGENLDLLIGLYDEKKNDDANDKKEKDAGKKRILEILKDKYDIEEKDFLSAELEVVPEGKARLMGLDSSMILSYGQDDRVCSFTSFEAMMEEENPFRTTCCLIVDKEEIGSVGSTGMDSKFLENATAEVLDKLNRYSSLTLSRVLRNSLMLSSDVNAAYDPMYSNLFDNKNSSFLGKGVVFNKYTGSRGKSGASDANAEFLSKIRKAMDDANVDYQMAEMAKVDVGGGGTIAKYAAYYGMQVIDCGVAVLSMHAPFEVTSVKDVLTAKNAYKAFLKIK